MSTILDEIRAASAAASEGGNAAEAFTFAQWVSYVEQLERDLATSRADAMRWSKAHDRLQDEIWDSFGRWPARLRWGIGGHQPECHALMDSAISELLKLREGIDLLKRVARTVPAMAPGWRQTFLFENILGFLVNRGVKLNEIGVEKREASPV